MLERTYTAKRFDDALAQVKLDLGPDAVILSSRRIPSKMFGGPAQVELVALPPGTIPEETLPKPAPQQSRTARLKALQDALVPGLKSTQAEANDGESLNIEKLLRDRATPRDVANEIAQAVRAHAGGQALDSASARRHLESVMADRYTFAGMIKPTRARIVALVGPTGVGKTTTIAKLAAQAALVDRYRVGLISIDQYRIGGTEQLGAYANLIGVPLESAHDAPSLRTAIDKLADAELILIDTAGRAPRDKIAVRDMATTLHQSGPPIQVHLCLSAATRDEELASSISRLRPLEPARLTITKMDEAIVHGSVLAAQKASGLAFAYFTTGQRVPEDIEVASPGRLAGIVCGEEA